MHDLFLHWRSNRDGVTAVEFAIVAPVLMFLFMGIVEFSTIMFAKSVMEGATNISSRLGKTGYVEAGKSREQMIVELLEQQSNGILDSAKIEITTLVYQNFSDIGAPEPFTDLNGNGARDENENFVDINGNGNWDNDMGQAGLGGAGDIVVYNVDYPWAVMTPGLSHVLANEDGNMPLHVSIVVRNEPYDLTEVN